MNISIEIHQNPRCVNRCFILSHKQCLSTVELLRTYHFQTKSSIGKEDFMNLCPSLIVHLDKEECKSATEPHIHVEEVEARPLGSIPLSGRETFNYQACNNGDAILDTGRIISPIG